MKKFLTIVLAAFLGGTAFAQQAPAKAKVESAEKFAAAKSKGTYEFQLPESVTAESVKKTSAYYTQYFTVNFDEKTKKAKLTMVQTDDKAKHVIVRFLVSNNVKEITMDGKDYSVDDFHYKFIQ